MKYLAFVLGLAAVCAVAVAQETNVLQTEVEEEYFQEQNQNPDKDVIYIFFNNQDIEGGSSVIRPIKEEPSSPLLWSVVLKTKVTELKNLKINTWDGRIWYPTFYDLD